MNAKPFQTFAQKILAEHSGKDHAEVGEIVEAEPDAVMSHDNAALVIKQFREIGLARVWNPNKIVVILDHRIPAESVKTANAHKTIRDFVKQQGIPHFYDVGEGVCHQVMLEKGHALPGRLVLGTDSHTTSYGCVAAASTGIGATEMAAVWALGKLWLRVPESIKIVLHGQLRPGVYAKDVVLHVIGTLTAEGANYKSVEFHGETVSKMDISARFTLANLAMEMGAKFAHVPFDDKTERFLRGVSDHSYRAVASDPGARYEVHEFQMDTMEPQLACPHQVDRVEAVSAHVGKTVHQAFLGSCTNGRLDDFEIAAKILKGRKVHASVRLLIAPASRSVYRQLSEKGLLQVFLDAGAVLLPSGCGPCLGAHQGLLADGETCIASSNRNFQGRMGSPKADVYLANPAVVAASAIRGSIQLPETA